jgi:hypothetical protein
MSKLISSALGLLGLIVMAPSSQAAIQNHPLRQRVDRELHAQQEQLEPIRNSVLLRTIVQEKTTPTDPIEAPRLNRAERQQEFDRRKYEEIIRQRNFLPSLDSPDGPFQKNEYSW